ncbi:MAG: hypothetical protein CMM47_11860 [Rhodospirillaceae bacterium]|nr:hypothetical protein [Rhodospirillaceae bacterium]
MNPEDLPDLRGLKDTKNYQSLEYDPRKRVLLTNRPFTIFAMLLDRTLGDFIYRNLFAATVRLRFRNSRLIVYYRPDRPYKDPIIELNPYISWAWKSEGSNGIPIDYFDYMGGRPVRPRDKFWFHSLSAEPDLVLTPSIMDFDGLRGLAPFARFAVPSGRAGPLHEQLLRAGVNKHRWFCVLHYREAGYRDSDAQIDRDLKAENPEAIIDHIIQQQDGQVVRIGHPGMTPIPARPGFVDISGENESVLLHAYAVSRARYFLELTPSGPVGFASAFGVPMARCNALSTLGPLEKPSFAMMQHIVGPQGQRVPRDVAVAKGLYSTLAVKKVIARYGFHFVRNSLAELCAAANEIFERTADVQGWRLPGPPLVSSFPEEFTLPLAPPPGVEIIEFPAAMANFS